ncbi:MAG TPA: TlpA disulfide reductase family protein [Chthoniobacteraceae bacterium]|jgi:peroxiredoxin|nr:TlpA disulfide reductase family protein [Chthoniobacteraceae bacterium]
MRRILFLLLGLLALPVAPAVAQIQFFGGFNGIITDGDGIDTPVAAPGKGETQLRWQNGEILPGLPIDATETELSWKNPLFTEPLHVRWEELRRISRDLPSAPVTEAFSVRLRDGSHLYGDLKTVTADTVTLHSDRHGDFALKRSEVLSVRRLKGGSLKAAGPTGDVGWKEDKPNPNQPQFGRRGMGSAAPNPLAAGPGGALVLPYWNTGGFFAVALPPMVTLEFRVRSSAKPDFRLSLGAPKQELQIETWDEDLVALVGDEFKPLRKIADTEREIALRVCWDRPGHRCEIYNAAGVKLADWKVPDGGTAGSGLSLVNKGANLTLEFFRVREWEGDAPVAIDPKSPGIELGDGRFIPGAIAVSGDERLPVKGANGELSEAFPYGAIDGIVFSNDAPAMVKTAARATYADSTVLVGKVDSIKDNTLSLKTAFSAQPLKSKMDGMRELVLPLDPAKAGTPTGVDTLVLQQTTLHGKLTGEGTGSPLWVPVGGTKPVGLSNPVSYQVTRTTTVDPKLPNTPALFYTTSGDVLPGTLLTLDRKGIEMDSPIMEAKSLPATSLNAIQFGVATPQAVKGFRDGWRVLKGTEESVVHTDTELKMKPETSIGHSSVMAGDEITFDAQWSNFSSMRLRVFCDGLENASGSGIMIGMFGEQWTSGLESSEGQMENQVQTRMTGKVAKVKLVIKEKTLELHLNGNLVQSFPFQASKRTGSGLIIEPSSLWGNPTAPLTLTNFQSRAAVGRAWLPDFSREAKSQALTVPRFRKDDPPRQALLAGNGDLLRGEVEAVTKTHIGFRSGLENLKVPTDRVKAIIWLQPAEKDAKPASAAATKAESLFERRLQRHTRYRSGSLGNMLSFLAQEVPELRFQPPGNDNVRRSFDFGGQTIREALDQLCSIFGVRYRVEGGDKVIFEAGTLTSTMPTTVYWLKPEAFPSMAPAQEVLAGKGLTFPTGAGADWVPEAGQLTMTNTPDNHTKLVAVLAKEYGGSLGSPTHWLQLASGARLGLVVEKFDKDAIVGHHPLYGKCRVPLTDVFTVRTTPPDPTNVMRNLQGWRLVNAPEPVIEGASGESAPLVGKDAKTFKLPLLAGEEFDLAQQRGKVVVLDFWATWCGPCIKSLPGLIEAMAPFSSDKVQFIGVNQSEAPELVKRFMEARGWKFQVALDAGGKVATQYGVDGIPTTVIIAQDGKIAWLRSGYDPENEKIISDTVKRLLDPTKPADAPVP